mgnify:CR=1 FL=1
MKFSELQKRIAISLINGSKTAEDLAKELNASYAEIIDELKKMMKLNLIEKEGFPTKYKLKEFIVNELKRRREIASADPNKLRLKAIIEVKAISEELLKKELQKVKELLQNEKDFTIYSITVADPIKEAEHYSAYLDVELSLKDFRAISKLLFFYGPTALEVLKPEKITFAADDLQDALVEMASYIHSYNQYIARILNKTKLDEFRKQLFS